MNEQGWLNYALTQIHSGQWFGFNSKEQNYSTLVVHDSSITKPTEAEVNAKIQEIKDAEAKKIADKASANAKLKALGLTDDEIEAIK